jgi:hypothetical protein
MGLDPQPALGLVDEMILIVVNANCANCAFAKVEDFMTGGRAFAGEHGGLVVAINVAALDSILVKTTNSQATADEMRWQSQEVEYLCQLNPSPWSFSFYEFTRESFNGLRRGT